MCRSHSLTPPQGTHRGPGLQLLDSALQPGTRPFLFSLMSPRHLPAPRASLPILPLEGGALSNEARHGPGVPGLGREAGAGTAELADDTKTVQVAVWSTCSREAGQRTPWTPPGRMVLPLGPSGS